MTDLARKRTEYHCILWRRCTGECIFSSVLFRKERLSWFIILIRYGILRCFVDEYWQKCLLQASENWRMHPSVEWPFIVPMTRIVVAMLSVPHTNGKQVSGNHWTLHAPEAPHEVYLTTRVFSFACSFPIPSRWRRCELLFGIRTCGIPLPSFHSVHLLFMKALAIGIILCSTSSWASSSSVPIACIQLFTAESNSWAPCLYITVSSSGLSGTPESSHIAR